MHRTNSNMETGGLLMGSDRLNYLVIFCALMLVNNSKATLEQSLRLVPLAGRANCLAKELLREVSAAHPHRSLAS